MLMWVGILQDMSMTLFRQELEHTTSTFKYGYMCLYELHTTSCVYLLHMTQHYSPSFNHSSTELVTTQLA